jgi:hypothetical protein
MAEMDRIDQKEQGSRLSRVLWTLLRVFIYGLGAITVWMFFFSFIAIIVGTCFLLIDKKGGWNRVGAVLAFAGGLSQFMGHNAHSLAPLILAMITGFVPIFAYLIFHLLKFGILKRIRRIRDIGRKLQAFYRNLPKLARVFLLATVILFPVALWASVSLNFQVMFDNNPRTLWVHSPSTVDIDEDFSITVEAWDLFERLSAVYKGTVNFSIESYNLTTGLPLGTIAASLPLDYTFTGRRIGSDMAYAIENGKDNGKHVFTANISTPGIHYIVVNDSHTGQQYFSNPVLVANFSQEQARLYWGDIHTHSMLSDGSGSAEHSYFYAREVACLEFSALTDHSEILNLLPNAYQKLEAATEAAYAPYEFVAFHGVEWTDVRTGHYTLIFSGDDLLKEDINSYWGVTTPAGLWAVLDDFTASTGCRALALPHHSTQKHYIQDWTYLNPKYVKIAEVASVHGDFLYEQRHPLNYRGAIYPPAEYTNGSSITDALRMGYRLTLYASSDTHDGHPGHTLCQTPAYVGHQRPFSIWHTRNEHPYSGGITAAWAGNLTREGVFTALENQRVFAVSDFGRPVLNFTINGVPVGDGATVFLGNATDRRNISVFLAQDGAPATTKRGGPSLASNFDPSQRWNATIEILKNGELFATLPVNSPVVHANFTDSTTLTGASYGVESCIYRDGEYYINEFSNNPVDPSLLNTNGTAFYILRVVGQNGRMAYAGPIWVEVE